MVEKRKSKGIEGPLTGLGLPFPPSRLCRHGQLVLEVGTFVGHLCADDVAPLPDLQVLTSRSAPIVSVSG